MLILVTLVEQHLERVVDVDKCLQVFDLILLFCAQESLIATCFNGHQYKPKVFNQPLKLIDQRQWVDNIVLRPISSALDENFIDKSNQFLSVLFTIECVELLDAIWLIRNRNVQLFLFLFLFLRHI